MKVQHRDCAPLALAGLLGSMATWHLSGCKSAVLNADDIRELAQQSIPSLREHVGDQEKVDLNVYLVGFPSDRSGADRDRATRPNP